MRPGGFISNKPVRRLQKTGRSLGGYVTSDSRSTLTGLAGLADVTAYLLNPSQIADLESRNPGITDMMNGLPPSGSWSIGYQLTDAVYGNVLISQDAMGRWNFVGNSPLASGVVNAPPYQSPVNLPGQTSCTDSIEDFAACAQNFASIALLVVGGYFVYKLLK